MTARKTTLLIVLDGWGYSDKPASNAIFAATKPTWDRLWRDAPHTLISGSGRDVGLPDGQMGNSEVGHMNLGAGRVVHQDLTRISKAVADGDFNHNPALCNAVDAAIARAGAVHLLGLLSPGGVHSHEEHFFAMARLAAARGAKRVYVHAFLDGRDMPPRSAAHSLIAMDALLHELGVGRVASIVGRYFAMDRDNRWDRVERAYQLLTEAKAPFTSPTALAALEAAYARNENDEFVQPTCVVPAGQSPVAIRDDDVLVFMNFRADRARELSRALLLEDFSGFKRAVRPKLADFVMLTQYAADIPASCAFGADDPRNTLGEYIASLGMTQLRIAETEKYAHVTFFFSGGREEPFVGEERILVPSPKVATYDLQPEMSAPEVTDRLIEAIEQQRFDLIVCNYANGDMVGHTGDFSAAVRAVETIDRALERVTAALARTGAQCLITADHGNVELMADVATGQAHTAHTCEPVPLVYVGPQQIRFNSGGVLSDIAPTLLRLMHLPVPKEMTGRVLLTADAERAMSR